MHLPKYAKLAIGAASVVVLAGATWAIGGDEGAASSQSTNNAYVQADFSTIAPRVSGTILKVLVQDNQAVKQGDLLAVIDDRDFRVALLSAQADLSVAEAKVSALVASLDQQDSVIAQARASVNESRAAISLAAVNAARYADLAQDGSASRQEQQEAASRLAANLAVTEGKQAALTGARDHLPVLHAQLAQARAEASRAQTQVEAARLNLSYTQIRAPIDGTVGQRTVRIGNVVQAGKPLLAVVPVRQAYIEARFRETQMAQIRPGQQVTVEFDALPDLLLKGRVESLAPATGISYAEVAPANQSGNFTKITQRLSVRIALDQNQRGVDRLRVGMSAVPTISVTEPED